jgi:ketosteroid isomerase-like protein
MGIAQRFFDACAIGDYHSMGLMYAPTATFSDPIFPLLSGPETALMWEMLLTRAQDFCVSVNVEEEESQGGGHARAVWVARYLYGATGRHVENRVRTEMTCQAGRIVKQVDHFSFWNWSRQALGAPGLLLGWTPIVRKKVQQGAQAQLIKFADRKFGRQGMPAAR